MAHRGARAGLRPYIGTVTAKYWRLPHRVEEGRGDLSAPSRSDQCPGLEAVFHGAVHKRCEVDAAVTSIVDAAARFHGADLLAGNQFPRR